MKTYTFINAYIIGGQLAFEAPGFDTLDEAWRAMLYRIDALIALSAEVGADSFELEQEYIALEEMEPQPMAVNIAGELFEVQEIEGVE